MYSFRRRLLLGVIAFTVVLGGCGGGDDDTTATAISKRVLVEKANAYCKKDNEQLSAAFDRYAEERRTDQVRFAVEHVIPMREAQIRFLRKLGPPAEDAIRFDEMLVAMEEGIERAERFPKSLISLEDGYAFKKAFELGLALGLERCWLN
jgi:hypothetical protein